MSDEASCIVLTSTDLPALVPGAMRVTASCGHECWISPSGLRAQLSMGLRSICMDCAPDMGEILAPTPEAREELIQQFGSEEVVDELVRRAQADPKAVLDVLRSKVRRTRQRRRR